MVDVTQTGAPGTPGANATVIGGSGGAGGPGGAVVVANPGNGVDLANSTVATGGSGGTGGNGNGAAGNPGTGGAGGGVSASTSTLFTTTQSLTATTTAAGGAGGAAGQPGNVLGVGHGADGGAGGSVTAATATATSALSSGDAANAARVNATGGAGGQGTGAGHSGGAGGAVGGAKAYAHGSNTYASVQQQGGAGGSGVLGASGGAGGASTLVNGVQTVAAEVASFVQRSYGGAGGSSNSGPGGAGGSAIGELTGNQEGGFEGVKGGSGGGGTPAGAGGNASGLLSLTASAPYVTPALSVVGGSGGDALRSGGSGGAGGAVTQAAVSATSTAPKGNATATVAAGGGAGGAGSGVGHRGGAGGAVSQVSARAVGFTGYAAVRVGGGSGGAGANGAAGGDGASVTLTNAVSGASAGGSLFLRQAAYGGSAGSGTTGPAGAAGAAVSNLTFDDRVNPVPALSVTGYTLTEGGNGGGDSYSGMAPSAGGSASSMTDMTAMGVASASAKSFGGSGPAAGSLVGAAGGAAAASATATNTGAGSALASARSAATGGSGGAGFSGGAGGAVTGSTAKAAAGGAGLAEAAAYGTGGTGGRAYGRTSSAPGGAGGSVSGVSASAAGFSAKAYAAQYGGASGGGYYSGAGGGSTLVNAVTGSTRGGYLLLKQSAYGGANGAAQLQGAPGGIATSTLSFDDTQNAISAHSLTGITNAVGGSGSYGGYIGDPVGKGDATSDIHLTGRYAVNATANAVAGLAGEPSGADLASADAVSVGTAADATATSLANASPPFDAGTGDAEATADATASTAAGQAASATSEASGPSGAVTTAASTHGAGAVSALSATTQTLVDGDDSGRSQVAITGSLFGFNGGQQSVYASATGLPDATAVSAALTGYNAVAVPLGTSQASVLGLGWQGGFDQSGGVGTQDYKSTVTLTLDTMGLTGDLVLGLLAAEMFGSGFSSLGFSVDIGGTQALDLAFSTPSAAEAYFSDHALDLGAVTQSPDLTVTFNLDLVEDSAGSGFGVAYAIGTTGNPAPITPLPATSPTEIDITTGIRSIVHAAIYGYTIRLAGVADSTAQPVLRMNSGYLAPQTTVVLGDSSGAPRYGQIQAIGYNENRGLITSQGSAANGSSVLTISVSTVRDASLGVTQPGVLNNIGTISASKNGTVRLLGDSGSKLVNTGTLSALAGGFMVLDINVTDTGQILIDDGTLETAAPVSTGQSIDLQSGTLTIDDPAAFYGTIYDFSPNDQILLKGTNVTSVTYDNGALLLDGGADGVLHFRRPLGVVFDSNSFVLNHGANGDTVITTPSAVTPLPGASPTPITGLSGRVFSITKAQINGYTVRLNGATGNGGQAAIMMQSGSIGSNAAVAVGDSSDDPRYGLIQSVGYNENHGLLTAAGAVDGSSSLELDVANVYDDAGNTVQQGVFNNSGTISATAGATISILGDQGSKLINTGSVSALSGGAVFISANVTDRGSMLVNGGSLELGGAVSTGQSVDVLSGKLTIDDPLAFHGTIYDFGSKDQIVLPTADLSSVTYDNGALLLDGGAEGVLHFHRPAGAVFASNTFALSHFSAPSASFPFGIGTIITNSGLT